MKKRLLLVAGFLIGLCIFISPSVSAKADEYDITSYDVNIDVTEGNLLHITEKIGVNFNVEKHGIYRSIPMRNEVTRTDESTDIILASIDNIECSDEFSASSEEGNEVLQIGDEDVTFTGPHTYTISYDYDLGNDPLENEDEFYFNLIGTGWNDTTISNVTFTVKMPKKFDEGKLGISYGREGSKETDGILYGINGNTISGKLDESIKLRHNEGLTMRLSLPEGYFLKADHFDSTIIFAIVLSIIGSLLAVLLWYKFGRDDEVIETVEFYPPEGKNSVEVAYLYKGFATKEDIVSLLIILANKGYISIEEDPEKSGNKDFRINKVKPYDGNNELERTFMAGLFDKRNYATKKTLKYTFFLTIDSISSMINNPDNKRKIFFANSLNKNWILYALILIVLALITYVPVKDHLYDTALALMAMGGFGFGFGGMLFTFFGEKKILSKIFSLLWGVIIGGLAHYIFIGPALMEQKKYIPGFIIGLIGMGVMIFFSRYMTKRTPYGNEMLGKIGGFKTFLETAEKDRLESMVEENPTYFYDILPYTYVLGVSDIWMKKFEDLAIEQPQWYSGSTGSMFNYMYFSSFMNQTMRSATASMSSSPSSSGGGSSGGGSGGGGGGSW